MVEDCVLLSAILVSVVCCTTLAITTDQQLNSFWPCRQHGSHVCQSIYISASWSVGLFGSDHGLVDIASESEKVKQSKCGLQGRRKKRLIECKLMRKLLDCTLDL